MESGSSEERAGLIDKSKGGHDELGNTGPTSEANSVGVQVSDMAAPVIGISF